MKIHRLRLLTAALFCLISLGQAHPSATAWAHHATGHAGTVGASFNPYSSQSRPPATFLDFNFNVDRLDGDLGYLLSYQLAAEYRVFHSLSLGARVPLVSVREKFLADTDRLGDVGFSVKGLVKEWTSHRMFLVSGMETTFPTGSEDLGTGTGNVMLAPYFTFSRGFRWFSALVTLGSTLAASESPNPSIDYAASLILSVVQKVLPMDLVLSFQGSTITSGATRDYIRPAVVFHLSPRLLATLGGKFSVTDAGRGILFDINYSF